jgi:hypothetical protein
VLDGVLLEIPLEVAGQHRSRRSCSAPRQNDAERMPPPEQVITSRPESLPSSMGRLNVAGGSSRTPYNFRWPTRLVANKHTASTSERRVDQQRQPAGRLAGEGRAGRVVDRGAHRPLDHREDERELECLVKVRRRPICSIVALPGVPSGSPSIALR